jgi:hypothetical protein
MEYLCSADFARTLVLDYPHEPNGIYALPPAYIPRPARFVCKACNAYALILDQRTGNTSRDFSSGLPLTTYYLACHGRVQRVTLSRRTRVAGPIEVEFTD